VNRRSTSLKAIIIAAATPNLATDALALESNAEVALPAEISTDAAPVILAQQNQLIQRAPAPTLTADQARQAVRTELASMTPEQKARLGRSQVEIENLAVQAASATKCGANITNGVGCTDPFSGGFACCLVTLGPPA
jgi:hypothetical protein